MSRWPQIIGTAALLAAVGSVGWRAATQYEKPNAAAATASATLASPLDSTSVPQATTPARATQIAAASVAQSVTRPFAPGEIEVCGIGRAQADSPEADRLMARANDAVDGDLAVHLRRMRASGDERTRAAALMVLGDLPSLVTMAMRSNDPMVFAFAQQGCLRRDARDTGSPCALLGDEQGARLDPANGAAWLRVADAALLRGETDNMVAALRRVAASPVHDTREFGFYALAMDALPVGITDAERLRLSVGLIGTQASLVLSSYRSITTHCTEALARDVNRRPLCEALAEHLLVRGSLLIDAAIGARIGERAGWSAERVERTRARVHALSSFPISQIDSAAGGPVSCEAMKRAERWWIDGARLGERTVAERWLAQQNLSDAQLLDRYREFQRQRAAAASAPR